MHRVVWRLDTGSGTLYRRQWHALTPVDARAAGPEVAVMSGVERMVIRSHWPRSGWVDGVSLLVSDQGPSGLDSDARAIVSFGDNWPEAIEVTLITRDHGRIPLLETWQ